MRLTHRLIEPLETRYAPAALITISSAGAVSETEGTLASFTVSISEAPSPGQPITVHYSTADGTAIQTLDYQAMAGDLTFGEDDPLTKTITVPIQADALNEADETFTVKLSDASGGSQIAADQGVATATI